jgi:hypothetical protein
LPKGLEIAAPARRSLEQRPEKDAVVAMAVALAPAADEAKIRTRRQGRTCAERRSTAGWLQATRVRTGRLTAQLSTCEDPQVVGLNVTRPAGRRWRGQIDAPAVTDVVTALDAAQKAPDAAVKK